MKVHVKGNVTFYDILKKKTSFEVGPLC